MGKDKISLLYQDTFVYIDVSNIRSACLKTLGFRIDFVRFLNYFQRKYPNLKDVRYYERVVSDNYKECIVMKSNVDVYLAAELVAKASRVVRPTRLILVSCDGDYAEAIKTALKINKNISVAVIATPFVRNYHKNTVSVRLKNLVREIGKPRFLFCNINELRSLIENKK